MPRQIYPLPRSILDEYKGLPLYLSLSPSTLLTDFSTLLGLYSDIGPLFFLGETIYLRFTLFFDSVHFANLILEKTNLISQGNGKLQQKKDKVAKGDS